MAPLTAADYQQRTAYLQQEMARLRQQMAQAQVPNQQVQPSQMSRSPFASTPEFEMPNIFGGGMDANGQYDPFALSTEEQHITNGLSNSAFSGTRGGLGMDFNQYTNADDVFGDGFMTAMGQYSTSPFASNYKSSSELFIEGQNGTDPDFMRDVRLLTASTTNGKPYDVLGTGADGKPHKPNTDLSPKKMKEILFQAYAKAAAEKALNNGQPMPTMSMPT